MESFLHTTLTTTMARKKRKSKKAKPNSKAASRDQRDVPSPADSTPTSRTEVTWIIAALVLLIGIITTLLVLRPGGYRKNNGESREQLSGISEVDMRETSVTIRDNKDTWRKLDDPKTDGWETESLQKAAKAKFASFLNALTNPDEELPTVSDDFRSTVMVPIPGSDFRNMFSSDGLNVEAGSLDFLEATGAEAATELRDQLTTAYPDSSRWALKPVGVKQSGKTVEVEFLLAFAGSNGNTRFESHGKCMTQWDASEGLDKLTLVELQQERLELTSLHGSQPTFVDRTQAVLGRNDCFASQLQVGLHHWLGQSQDTRSEALLGTPGLAIADINGDARPDLYLCQEFGLPNRLFIQQPDGTLQDVSADAGVDWLESSRGCLLVDFDQDGDRDLAVAMIGHVIVATNDGTGKFQIAKVLPTSEDTMSLAAADYDNDADVDLFVCCYQPNDVLGTKRSSSVAIPGAEFVYHDAATGAANSLFRNDSNSDGIQFADVTAEAGLAQGNTRYSFAASFEDYDNDGDQDLYIANDYGPNNLYRNDQMDGRTEFVDIAAETNAQDRASGMSVAWGDYDRDGRMDVHVSNMFSSAGNRVTSQSKFKPEVDTELKQRLRRFARGNTLLRNGDEQFEDVSQPAGITIGRWAWGSLFADINNDGWEDLLVANGYMTTPDSGDL
ncbi:MAG: VCBS repeat-containing protein [Planctomycetota bacterium]